MRHELQLRKGEKIMGNDFNNYNLIPLSDITDEARKIAVAWGEAMSDDSIMNKHKLASDIMNYAKNYHKQELAKNKETLAMSNLTAVGWFANKLSDCLKFKTFEEKEHYVLLLGTALDMEYYQHNKTWVDSAIVITHEKDPEEFDEYWKEIYGKDENNGK